MSFERSELDRNYALQLQLVTYDVSVSSACEPGHVVGGIIALGRGRLVSL